MKNNLRRNLVFLGRFGKLRFTKTAGWNWSSNQKSVTSTTIKKLAFVLTHSTGLQSASTLAMRRKWAQIGKRQLKLKRDFGVQFQAFGWSTGTGVGISGDFFSPEPVSSADN